MTLILLQSDCGVRLWVVSKNDFTLSRVFEVYVPLGLLPITTAIHKKNFHLGVPSGTPSYSLLLLHLLNSS